MNKNYYRMKRPIQNNKLLSSIFIYCCLMLNTNIFAQPAIIEYATDPSEVLISFTETHGVMTGDDAQTRLEIYGDGTVEVQVPSFMKKAGSYQMKLDKVELDQLLQDLAAKDIPEFDSEKTQANKENMINVSQTTSAQPTLYEVHDASVTNIVINLDRYLKLTNNNTANGQVIDASNEVFNLRKKITWKGIRDDSKKFPDIEEIQKLAAAQQSLLDIIDNPQLVKRK